MTPTTELEAVNIMLSSIGESPVNSLNSGLVDAELAKTILNATSREVQSRGWKFNTETKYPLSPNIDGEVILPANTMKVDSTTENGQRDLIQRGNKLYDMVSHSYKINDAVELTLVLFLGFDLLPEAARHYITIRAARIFQDRAVGSDVLHAFQEKDEMMALVELKDAEGDTGDYTIFDNYSVARVLDRRITTRY